jgi:hypothetical protein
VPFTLQLTEMSAELETEAVKVSVSPSNTVPEFGVTLISMEGGGGGGLATRPAPPPPQPRVHAPVGGELQSAPAGADCYYFCRLLFAFAEGAACCVIKQAEVQRDERESVDCTKRAAVGERQITSLDGGI